MALAQLIMLWLCLGFLAVIAWRDFLTFRIRNQDVMILTGMVALLVLMRAVQGANVTPDLLAGVLLFVLGFVMWMLGAMGAGDVKLYFPLGVLVGWALLPIYVVFLLLASILMLVAVWVGRRFPREEGGLRARLTEIARARTVPYAVPMVIGATLTLLPQALRI
ncbi:MAG: prepilin peptidase [Rhodobacterales bacterium]|nr:prepilin peptidase [Rhodobacterales bacterium]